MKNSCTQHSLLGQRTASLAALFLGALSIIGCSAETPTSTEQSTGPQSESFGRLLTHTIQSTYPEQERVISVRLPRSYSTHSDKDYPVLYILDGDNNMEMTTEIVGELVESGAMPEVIIVGLHAGHTRRQDYLPEHPTSDRDGLAHRHHSSIENELLPFIDDAYRTSSVRVLSGHSWGAMFTLFAMTENPDQFDAYLAQSPNLRERWSSYFFPRIEQMFRDHGQLEASFYVVMGNERRSQEGYDAFIALLSESAPATFHWADKRHPDASHMETREPGMRDGLKHVFSNR